MSGHGVVNLASHRKFRIWGLGIGALLCVIGLSFILPNRALRWWDLGGQYEKPQWSPDRSYALISFRDFKPFSPKSMKPAIYKFTPHDGQFTVWRAAEWPGAIRWSRDGLYVAYLDLISIEQEKQWELHIVDLHCEACNKTIRLTAFDTQDRLAWSPSGKWILLHETHREDQNTLTGFTFVATDDPVRQSFWQDSENYNDLDWSVDGNEIIAITVPQPWVGTNKMHIIHVPEEFR